MWTLIFALTGCDRATLEADPPALCEAIVEDGEGFFEHPFPHDNRLVDGRASYADFPQRDVSLVNNVVEVAERSFGWSGYGTLYVPFDAPIDTDRLPDLAGSLGPDSPVQLVPVDPAEGSAVPVHVRWFDAPTSLLPANTLAVRPAWGRGMRPGVAYELRLSPTIGCTSPDSDGVTIPLTIAPNTDLLRDMVTVARAELADASRLGDEFTAITPPFEGTLAFRGRLTIPRWQQGTVPYATEGGDIALDASGLPIVDGYDEVDVAFVHPNKEPPAGGWPVLIHLNGTGGSYVLTYLFGGTLAQGDIAAIGIDLPLHGERGVGPAFEAVVNLDNPLASVMSLLQGAADQVWLADRIASGVAIDTPLGPVPLDPTRIGFQGHSQGGIHGALAAAHWDGKVKAAMFSGTGGGTFQGALFNESTGIDVAGLVGLLFDFVEGETLDDFHPLASLIQHAADQADPLNTAPFWFAEAGLQDRPLPAALVTLGTADPFTPPLTTQAMAHAAGVPVAFGDYRIPADQVFPPVIDSIPVEEPNAMGFDGSAVTGGIVQYVDGDHGVGLDDVSRWTAFFETALLEDAPMIR
ncbi:MAG: hypothetical protein AAGA48_41055 [Myxococcota bacterium]